MKHIQANEAMECMENEEEAHNMNNGNTLHPVASTRCKRKPLCDIRAQLQDHKRCTFVHVHLNWYSLHIFPKISILNIINDTKHPTPQRYGLKARGMEVTVYRAKQDYKYWIKWKQKRIRREHSKTTGNDTLNRIFISHHIDSSVNTVRTERKREQRLTEYMQTHHPITNVPRWLYNRSEIG